MNQLKVSIQQSINALADRGWSQRRIAREYLLEVIMRRYETRSTIMTSNRPLEDWGKLLQDVPTAGAVLDRFLHHATVFAITGESYRLKDSALDKTGGKKHA